MKKINILSCAIFSLTLLSSCSLHYNCVDEGNFVIGYSEIDKNAFIGPVLYTIGESTDIVLPSFYNNYPITKLGGYYGTGVPTPFYIEVTGYNEEDTIEKFSSNEDFITNLKNYYEDYSIYDYNLNITLPEELDEINYVEKLISASVKEVDGNKIVDVYRVRCSFTISEKNKYFYTENGKVYDKKTNELIDKFIYQEDI